MFNNYAGTKFVGAPSLQTSVAGAEILTDGLRLYNLTFIADQPCTIKINGEADAIYVRASQTVQIQICVSLIVVEGGITYNWIAQEG